MVIFTKGEFMFLQESKVFMHKTKVRQIGAFFSDLVSLSPVIIPA